MVMPGSLPAIDAPIMPTVTKTPTQTDTDQALRNQAINSGYGISHINNPLLRGVARAADIAASVFIPGEAKYIPGTSLNHNYRVDQLTKNVVADQAQDQATAQTAETDAGTAGKQATAAYEKQKPILEQNKIDATALNNHAKYAQLAARAGQTMVVDPNTGEATFQDDPNSQAYQDRIALANMHQATADKNAVTSEIAQNKYKPGTPEYNDAQRRLSQVDQRLQVAMGSLGLRAQGLQLRKQNTDASLYGTDLDGNPLPGATQITGDNGAVTTVGSKNAGHAITQQGAVGGFKDLSGSLVHTRAALQDFFNEGGSLSDPKMAAAMSDPEGVTSQVIHGWIQSGMSPRAVAALTALKQYHEQAGILRTATKGTSSEAGAQRILETAPTAGDANDVALSKLNEGQNVIDRLTPGVSTVSGGLHVKPTGNGSAGGDSGQKAAPGPKEGDVVDGYRFKGGNAGDQKNWVKQ
jgi:hypothetical protein